MRLNLMSVVIIIGNKMGNNTKYIKKGKNNYGKQNFSQSRRTYSNGI